MKFLWTISLCALALSSRLLGVTDTTYLGMSAEMGYNTDPAFVRRSIYELRRLGLGSTRMGMDNVGGQSVGAAFDFGARNYVVDQLIANGIEIRAVVSPRSMANSGASFTEWTNNWNHFVRGVMNHYRGKVNYYIIGNEPDLTTNTPAQFVEFTKIAFVAARSIDPSIKIQSPPVSAPNGGGGSYLNQMLQLGVADYCDYIGLHIYGGQIQDQNFLQPWQRMAALGIQKPIRISESGTNPDWAPAGLDGQEWRRRWLAQFYVAMKRAGIDHTLLFSLTFGEREWAYLDLPNNWQPIEPGYSEILHGLRDEPFANGGFEAPNDHEREWHVYFNPDLATPPATIGFITNDVAGARSGSGYLRMNVGTASSRSIVRRVAGQLTAGSTVRLSAWVYVNASGATAQLKALGFDPMDGDREITTTSTQVNTWELLSVDVPVISNRWVVTELSASATGFPGDYVKWDDAEVTVITLAPPAPPSMVTARGRDAAAEVWWQPAPGAVSYAVRRATTTNAAAFSLLGTVTNLSFLDTNVTNGGTYFYRVAAVNSAGSSADSDAARAQPAPMLTPVTLVATGSVWKYLDDGSNQGTAWRATNFNDSGWLSGRGTLGYGDPVSTTVRANRTDGTRIITTYFRHRFVFEDAGALTNLTLGLMRDDGGVVYLNATPIFWSHMPQTGYDYLTRATATVDGPSERTYFTTNLPPSLLRAGTNVIAVEIHQVSSSSSDIAFDLFLSAQTSTRPRLDIVRSNQTVTLRWPRLADSYAVAARDGINAPWAIVGRESATTNHHGFELTLTNETPARFYQLFYTDPPY